MTHILRRNGNFPIPYNRFMLTDIHLWNQKSLSPMRKPEQIVDTLDKYDLKILRAIQADATLSMQELGDTVGLSHTPCWRRVKKLEEEGYIKHRVTLLSAEKLDLAVTVHAYLTIKKHDEESLIAFESSVDAVKEVVECYSVTGEKDYVLRVIVSSVDHYEKLLKTTLVHLPNVASINSVFALKQIKYTTELPI